MTLRSTSSSSFVFLMALSISLGCAGRVVQDPPQEEPSSPPGPVLVVPEPRPDYPAGPYGKTKGAIVQNFSWSGYRDGLVWDDRISLRDYYDPDGSRGIRAIRIMLGAVWCAVDNTVAARLRTTYPAMKSRGVRIVSGLVEDAVRKSPTRSTLDTWIAKFNVSYDLVLDPDHAVAVGALTFPYNVIVDPRTMVIVAVVSGDVPTVDALIDDLVKRNGG